MIHDFFKYLNDNKSVEEHVAKVMEWELSTDQSYDFLGLGNKKIEMKTERYFESDEMSKEKKLSPNYFFEFCDVMNGDEVPNDVSRILKYPDKYKTTGTIRAVRNEVDYWLHGMRCAETAVRYKLFDTKALNDIVCELGVKAKLASVPNRRWNTYGIKLNRKLLNDLVLEEYVIEF